MDAKKQKRDDGESIKTDSITQLPDGTICIGSGCTVLRIKPGADVVEVDASECDEDTKQALVKAIGVEGRATQYKMKKEQTDVRREKAGRRDADHSEEE